MPILKYTAISIILFSWAGFAAAQAPAVSLGVDVSYLNSVKAESWGLTTTEYDRYLILQEVDKSFSAENSSPLEVLGKHAETTEEKNKYAKMYAHMYSQNQVRALEWSIAVQNAVDSSAISVATMYESSSLLQQHLTGQGVSRETVMGNGASQRKVSVTSVIGKRALLFVDIDCDSKCVESSKSIIERQSNAGIAGLDIVFSGSSQSADSERQIAVIAAAMGVTPERISSKRISLNYDSPNTESIPAGRALPLLVNTEGNEIII